MLETAAAQQPLIEAISEIAEQDCRVPSELISSLAAVFLTNSDRK